MHDTYKQYFKLHHAISPDNSYRMSYFFFSIYDS